MVKKKEKVPIINQKIINWALFLGLLATNVFWMQAHQAQELSLRAESEGWLKQQVYINELEECINSGDQTCNINRLFEEQEESSRTE